MFLFDWSYELSDYVDSDLTVAFDSFMVEDDSLEPGDLRLLAVDSYLVLPVNTSIRLLISSTDVILLILKFYIIMPFIYNTLRYFLIFLLTFRLLHPRSQGLYYFNLVASTRPVRKFTTHFNFSQSRGYSTKTSRSLNPIFLTGLIDAADSQG